MNAIEARLVEGQIHRFEEATWKEDLKNVLRYVIEHEDCRGAMFSQQDLELLIKLVGEK